MGTIRCTVILFILIIVSIIISNISARHYFSRQINERIDCYPEAGSQFLNYSKKLCLDRNCFVDDEAGPNDIQCYLSPNYGYILQDSPLKLNNGLRLKLKRNSAVDSMFQQPIENVFLDVQHYTNDIIRFKLYDADNKRYEVRRKMIYNAQNF